MKKQEIENQVKLIERIDRCKKALPTLKINWETDIEKMPFQEMIGGDWIYRNWKPTKTATHKLEKEEYDEKLLDLFNGQNGGKMLPLIELVMTGRGIIPPIFAIEYQIIDGKKSILKPLHLVDGTHRVRLSRYLGLSEIPITITERIQKYKFTLPFEIEYKDSCVVIKKNGIEYLFNYNEWYLDNNYDRLAFDKMNL